ncbi:YhgE/Pip domain-containing protein [Paenibacillus methanolicus]|uniref:Putative membrane protein n=1 Tax=Paenibacillus methanolicus TaxID=582686 RepID=A0A5S5C8N4_9BACL|nr:YhgE/Pip domain-containing protein [Paenibacillus methanolicus]TYP75765.1 putative membrane protein [Paenibacillus methanolicus]
MKGLQLLKKEWTHILSKTQARIGIAILLLISLIYAGMFLGGYWDPYGHLDRLPVAVVNMDEGAEMDGKPIHIGQDLTEQLKLSGSLDFRFVGETEAEQGLEVGRYYMSVIIPGTFSQQVTTLTSGSPEPAKLIYRTNPGQNFVAGQIGSSAVEKLKDQVGNEITKTYTEALFANMSELAAGIVAAAGGASELNGGLLKERDGMDRLQDGIDELAEGAARLNQAGAALAGGKSKLLEGAGQLSVGSGQLVEGLRAISQAQGRLTDSAASTASMAGNLAAGFAEADKRADRAAAEAAALSERLERFALAHPELAYDASFQDLAEASESLGSELNGLLADQTNVAGDAQKLSQAQKALAEGSAGLLEKLSAVAQSSANLATGAAQAEAGIGQWETGFRQYETGIHNMASGISRLGQGVEPLAGGIVQLADGSEKLAGKLADAGEEASAVHADGKLIGMFARPVQLVENKVTDVPNYGAAMVPYFLTLGLFVGGLIASNILPYERRSKYGVSGWHHFVNKYGLFLSIAVLQTLVVDGVLLLGFGIGVQSVWKFLLLSLTASFTYFTCILMLVSVIGPLGRLAAVFLLVAQLATSGGTFPMELAVGPMQAIGRCLPMTYAVNAFRAAVTTGDWGQYWSNFGILLIYTAAFVGIALAVLWRSNKQSSAALQGGIN